MAQFQVDPFVVWKGNNYDRRRHNEPNEPIQSARDCEKWKKAKNRRVRLCITYRRRVEEMNSRITFLDKFNPDTRLSAYHKVPQSPNYSKFLVEHQEM